jgi:hypothetical protein
MFPPARGGEIEKEKRDSSLKSMVKFSDDIILTQPTSLNQPLTHIGFPLKLKGNTTCYQPRKRKRA